MYKESDIAYELGEYWVLTTKKGYEIYRKGITHSTRCAICGYKGEKGLDWCKSEIARRINL